MKRVRPVVLLTLLCVLAFGCSSSDSSSAPQTATTTPDTLHSEIQRGPVKVEVDIVPKEPRLSDEPTLTLTVTTEADVRVEMPPFGDSMGEFIIRDFYEPLKKTADGKQVQQQVYTLEPTGSGTMSIDPITVRFFDERSSGDGQEHTIETEALKLEVATSIGDEVPSLTDLRPAAGPVDLPDHSLTSNVSQLAVGLLAVLLIGLYLWKRSHSKVRSEPELTPQQLAWRELNDLLGSKLSESDVKEFFVQLTGVVRRYIERSTGVRAPEQTTEEFLREVNRADLFSGAENKRLAAFLESADLVKFAGYQPDADNIKHSAHLAKQFIQLKSEVPI